MLSLSSSSLMLMRSCTNTYARAAPVSALLLRRVIVPSSTAIISSFSTSTNAPLPIPILAPSGKKKNVLNRMYDEYSIPQQQNRIAMAERLFRFAQMRADDPRWYGPGLVGRDFRPRHAILTMHLWFLQKRLISKTHTADHHSALLVQEELFDLFWDDTQKRIREQGVAELTVNKHLNDVQQYTFQHLVHYDHAFAAYELQPKARFEELCGIVWVHVLNRGEQQQQEVCCSDQVQRMAYYIDTQYNNIVNRLPESYWKEGQLAWVNMPDFSKLRDNQGKIMPDVPVHEEDVLPNGWYKALTTAGESYYWNPNDTKSQWEKPITA